MGFLTLSDFISSRYLLGSGRLRCVLGGVILTLAQTTGTVDLSLFDGGGRRGGGGRCEGGCPGGSEMERLTFRS